MTFLPTRRNWLKGTSATAVLLAANSVRESFTPYRFPETVPVAQGTAATVSVDFALNSVLEEISRDEKDSSQTTVPRIVDVSPGGKRFRCDLYFHDSETGAKGFAFRSVDETGKPSGELRLVFPGRSNGLHGTPQENAAAIEIFKGKRSPQIPALQNFLKDELEPYLHKNPGLSISVFGHSLEAGLAVHAKDWLNQKKLFPKTTLFEPFAAAHEAGFILTDRLKATEHGVADKSDERDAKGRGMVETMRAGITNIASFPPTMIRELQVGGSVVGNMLFGDQVLTLSGEKDGAKFPEDPYRGGKVEGMMGGTAAAATLGGMATLTEGKLKHKQMSRRDFLSYTAMTAVVAIPLGTSGGGLWQEAWNEQMHQMALPGKILSRSGDEVLSRCTDTHQMLASPEKLLHPHDYPITASGHVQRIIAEGVTDVLART